MCQSSYKLENRKTVWVVGPVFSSLLCLREIKQKSKPDCAYRTDQNLTESFRSSLVMVIQTDRVSFKSCRAACNFHWTGKQNQNRSKFSSGFALRFVFIHIYIHAHIHEYLIFISQYILISTKSEENIFSIYIPETSNFSAIQ